MNSPTITRPRHNGLMHARSYRYRAEAALRWPQEQDKCFLVHAHRSTHHSFQWARPRFYRQTRERRGARRQKIFFFAWQSRAQQQTLWRAETEIITGADCRSCLDANIQDIKCSVRNNVHSPHYTADRRLDRPGQTQIHPISSSDSPDGICQLTQRGVSFVINKSDPVLSFIHIRVVSFWLIRLMFSQTVVSSQKEEGKTSPCCCNIWGFHKAFPLCQLAVCLNIWLFSFFLYF